MLIRSLASRLAIGAALWIGGALLVGGLALSAVFRGYVERSFDAHLEVLLDTLVASSEIDPGGELQIGRGLGDPRFEQPYSGWYWEVMDDRGPVARSRSLWDQVISYDLRLLEGGRLQALVQQPTHLRMVVREVRLPGSEQSFRYVVSGNRNEILREIERFNVTLAWSLGALGLGLVLAVMIQVRYGLLPLRRIRAALSDIGSGRAERLVGDYPTEVQPLVDEINILLDNNRAVVERARTHVGNLAHALKTPISVLTNAAAAPAPDPAALAETVRRQVAAMRRQVDHYLVRARTAATGAVLGARTEVLPVAQDLARTLERIHLERGISVAVEGGLGIHFRGERQDLEEMLGNLVDNACKWAQSRVRIGISATDGRLRITVDDDGPGLKAEAREAAFGRGKRLDEAVPGSGLGLAIVRDVAELYDGSVRLADSSLGGLQAVLELPAAETAAP